MKKNFSNSLIFESLVDTACNISEDTLNNIDEEVNSNYSFIILKDNKKTWSANFLLEIGNINELKMKKDTYLLE